MSLGIAVKAPVGLVLGAESRMILTVPEPLQGHFHINFDNATKLINFGEPYSDIGVITYGRATIGFRPAHSFMTEFEASLPQERTSVRDFAGKLGEFFVEQWRAHDLPLDEHDKVFFLVGGFDDNEPYARVYIIEIPDKAAPIEQHETSFGISLCGQQSYLDRLFHGFDLRLPDLVSERLGLTDAQKQEVIDAIKPLSVQFPLQCMPLQDCVNLVQFCIHTTIAAQELTACLRDCGGAIDIAAITRREGFQFVQVKTLGIGPPTVAGR